MASSKSKHELLVTTRMKDLVSKEFRKIGKVGKVSAAQIAAGFVAAKAAIAGMKVVVRGTINVIKSLTVEVAEQGDEFAKMSLRIGASVEALSEYKHVAEISGVAFNTLTMAWQRQTRRIAEAAKDTGEAKDAIKELGLSAIELNRLAPDQQFEALADALALVENKADRVRLAMKLWDSEGVRLVQVVNQGSAAIRAMKQDAHDLGLVYTEELAEASAEFNDALLRMKGSVTGVKMAIGKELLPVLTDAFDEMTEYVVENRDEIVKWSKEFIDKAIPAIKDFGKQAKPILRDVNSLLTVMGKSAQAVLKAFRLMGQISDLMGEQKAYRVVQAIRPNKRDTSELDVLGGLGEVSEAAARAAEPSGADVMSGLGGVSAAAAAIPDYNANLQKTFELQEEWRVSTEDTNTALEDLAQGGLSATTGAFNSFFDAMLSGTANTSEAFRNMVTSILSDMAKMAANKLVMQIIGAVAGAFTSGAGGATGQPIEYGKYGEYATGGVVPGRIGSPQLALVHGGEEVLTPAQRLSSGRGGSTTINMVVNPAPGMDERAVGEIAAASVVRKLRESRGFRSTIRGHANGGLY